MLCLIIIIAVVLFWILYRPIEKYGGQIKKIRKIPFNECARICSTYYESCINSSRGEDAGFCYERFGPRGTCILECGYSNYQRL